MKITTNNNITSKKMKTTKKMNFNNKMNIKIKFSKNKNDHTTIRVTHYLTIRIHSNLSDNK